jgi:hypothetical protein
MWRPILPLLFLLLLPGATGCAEAEAEAERLRDEGREALEAARLRFHEKRGDWEGALETELEDLNAEIDALRTRIESEGGDRLAEWEQKLEAQRDTARSKLDELRGAGEDSWERLHGEAKSEAKRLSDALKGALEQIK